MGSPARFTAQLLEEHFPTWTATQHSWAHGGSPAFPFRDSCANRELPTDAAAARPAGRSHNCEITAGMTAHTGTAWELWGRRGGPFRNRESQQAVEGESRKGAPPDRPPGDWVRRDDRGTGGCQAWGSFPVSCCAPCLLACRAATLPRAGER